MKKRKEKSEGLLVPESVCGEIALTATSGFQFDKSPTRWIKGAHEGDAHTQYYKPVADNDACKEYWIIIHNQTWQTPQSFTCASSPALHILYSTHLKPGFWQWRQSMVGSIGQARQFPRQHTLAQPKGWLGGD